MMQRNIPENSTDMGSANVRTDLGPSATRPRRRVLTTGRTAIWQARLALLVMINIAQLWILSATIEAALAAHFGQLIPLIVASGVCWLIALTIFLWWKPVEKKTASSRDR